MRLVWILLPAPLIAQLVPQLVPQFVPQVDPQLVRQVRLEGAPSLPAGSVTVGRAPSAPGGQAPSAPAGQTPSAPAGQKPSPFPEGKGRDALFKVCSGCHGAESVLGELKTREEWSKTLDEMASYGAEGTDAEYTDILAYLVQSFSLIVVNKATAQELGSTLDITPKAAAAIVQYREQHGRVASIDDLKKISGVDPAKIEARKDRLVF